MFHYWSHKYFAPKLMDVFSVARVVDFYISATLLSHSPGKCVNVLSIGSGDSSLEVSIAQHLLGLNVKFSIECRELSPVLCDRARLNIEKVGLGDYFGVIECDLNKAILSSSSFDLIIEDRLICRILELEHVFGK